MPITKEQIETLLPKLVKISNPADHIEVLDASRPISFQEAELGVAVHALRFDRYNDTTLSSLIEAFPAHQFLKALTIDDLKPLAEALKEAYEADVEAHRRLVDETS